MQKLRLLAAFLLAVPLLVFPLNIVLEFLPLPEGDGGPGDRFLSDMRAGGLMRWLALGQLLVGVGLLLARTRFAAALLHLPISLGMLAFHLTMMPPGSAVAAALLGLNLVVVADPARLRALVAPVAEAS